MREEEKFYEQEWSDWKEIKIMKKKELLWELYKERSNNLIRFITGTIIGIITIITILIVSKIYGETITPIPISRVGMIIGIVLIIGLFTGMLITKEIEGKRK